MKNKRWLPVLFSVLIVSTLGCGFFSKAGDDELIFAATNVGSPAGDKISKEIGPSGGTLISPDGRIELTVPPNALTETLPFSIQPISNAAGNSVGPAYRLEPNGKAFSAPLELAVHLSDHDLEGTVPEALSIAYQDEKGSWHAPRSVKLDPTSKVLKISVKHFTDYSILTRAKLSPAKSKIYAGGNQVITLVVCEKQGIIDRVLSRPEKCSTTSEPDNAEWKIQGPGTFDLSGGPGTSVYQAPAKKPTPNVAHMLLSFDLVTYAEDREVLIRMTLASEITIIDSSYRASGQDGPVTYSGIICSLDEPFTVTGKHPIFTYPFKFTPSSQTNGTMTYGTAGSGITASGGGTYTIVGRDTETPRIVLDTHSTARSPVGTTSGGGKATIILTPLKDGEGCN